MDEEGAPLLLPFADPNITHVLVTGAENAGKTALLRTIAVSLAMTNRQSKLQLLIIDPDRPGRTNHQLAPLMFLPHLLSQVIAEPEEGLYTLQILVEEMQYRLKHETIQPVIVALIDNVEGLLDYAAADGQAALAALLQRGAEAGIHLVLSTDQPGTERLTSVMRANLPLRLVGQVRDEAESLAATAVAGAEADYLLGEGDFLAVSDDSQVHFQAAFIGNYDLHLTLETILRNRPRSLLAQPLQALRAADAEDVQLHWQRDADFETGMAATTVEVKLDEDAAGLFEDDLQEN
jgi:S-DNA-T family DNA segregation ATPase FtsK/SpoIIIE